MVRENEREEITVSDGLQLGHTTVDQADVNTVEGEVDKLNSRMKRFVREREREREGERERGGGGGVGSITAKEVTRLLHLSAHVGTVDTLLHLPL